MPIDRIAVVGSGTMGRGIAQVAVERGFEVVLCDSVAEALERGAGAIRTSILAGVEKGRLTREAAEASMRRLSTTGETAAAVAAADLVIEAVPERLELKQAVLGAVEEAAPPGCLLATNTSSLSIGALAAGLRRPERFLGMHFFNPVPVMALLEIVVHAGTDSGALATAREVGERLGKTCIVVKDSPGFASSRLGIALGLEAMRMVEEGVASPRDIDAAMELGYRHPMGPLRLTDLVGLDVRLGIAEYLHRTLGRETFRPQRILTDMVREGRLGKKSGRGFYEW